MVTALGHTIVAGSITVLFVSGAAWNVCIFAVVFAGCVANDAAMDTVAKAPGQLLMTAVHLARCVLPIIAGPGL